MAAAFAVAQEVMAGAPDITVGADHYFAPAAMTPVGRVPEWAQGAEPTVVLGGHVFFRLRPGAEVARA